MSIPLKLFLAISLERKFMTMMMMQLWPGTILARTPIDKTENNTGEMTFLNSLPHNYNSWNTSIASLAGALVCKSLN